MHSMNRVILIGVVGADPELRATDTGGHVTRITILTANARKVDGAWTETTDAHRVVAYDRTAEYLCRYAKKGDLLGVDCALRPRQWEDAQGRTQHDASIVVDRIAALHSKSTPPTKIPPIEGPF